MRCVCYGRCVIEELDGLPEGARPTVDVLIVGAGAAGIAMAQDFAKRGVSVLVVEAGGRTPESYDRSMYEAEITGRPYSATWTRFRALGGSTRVWAGWCRPLDPWVFTRRSWVGDAAWPFRAKELNPWYRRASRLLSLGDYQWDGVAISSSVGEGSLKDVPGALTRLRSPAWRFMPHPRDFAIAFEGFLNGAKSRVLVDAAVVGFAVERNRVRSATVQSPRGRRVNIRFDHVVLAAGGIENVRLLWEIEHRLARWNRTINRSQWLGRGWQEHPHVPIGVGVFSQDALEGPLWLHAGLRDVGGVEAVAGFSFPTSVLKAERMAGFSATISDWYFGSDTPYVAGVQAAVRASGGSAAQARVVYARTESRVVRESRITLSPEKDRMGRKLPRLDWRIAPEDLLDLKRGARRLATAMAELNLGVMHENADEERVNANLAGGSHHIGGARMGARASDGVTNSYGAVFGLPNVHVTGSATFPTGGFANPTLTILALALRQSRNLAEKG